MLEKTIIHNLLLQNYFECSHILWNILKLWIWHLLNYFQDGC